jgi:hypothetical protein
MTTVIGKRIGGQWPRLIAPTHNGVALMILQRYCA